MKRTASLVLATIVALTGLAAPAYATDTSITGVNAPTTAEVGSDVTVTVAVATEEATPQPVNFFAYVPADGDYILLGKSEPTLTEGSLTFALPRTGENKFRVTYDNGTHAEQDFTIEGTSSGKSDAKVTLQTPSAGYYAEPVKLVVRWKDSANAPQNGTVTVQRFVVDTWTTLATGQATNGVCNCSFLATKAMIGQNLRLRAITPGSETLLPGTSAEKTLKVEKGRSMTIATVSSAYPKPNTTLTIKGVYRSYKKVPLSGGACLQVKAKSTSPWRNARCDLKFVSGKVTVKRKIKSTTWYRFVPTAQHPDYTIHWADPSRAIVVK